MDTGTSGTGHIGSLRALTKIRGVDPRRTLRIRLDWPEAAAIAATLALAVGFAHPAAYSAPSLRAVVETVLTLFASAAAVLMAQQFRHTRQLWKLLLFAALVIFALNEFIASALPAAANESSGKGFGAAFPLGQVTTAALLLLAALTPSARILIRPARPVLIAILASVTAVGVAEGIGLLLQGQLLMGARGQSGIGASLHRPVGFAVLIGAVALFAGAAAEFIRRARTQRSELLSLLAAGALLLGAARLYFLALPFVSSGAVSVREALRLLAIGFFFIAALRGDSELRESAARVAAVIERRRVARDLHDGLAQDLAFIAAHGATISDEYGEGHPFARAAQRALAVSRETISELSDPGSASVREALEQIGHELGAHFGIRVIMEVDAELTLVPGDQNHVERIVREAITNAARHGRAEHVMVSLKRASAGHSLRVIDDGSGIGAAVATEGFGIRTMRERAAVLGGSLSFSNRRSRGAELEVLFR